MKQDTQKDFGKFYPETIAQWRQWPLGNHHRDHGIWMITAQQKIWYT